MGALIMRESEQRKLQLVCDVMAGKLSRVQACRLLQVSENTLRRYIRAYEKKGPGFVKHGNCGRKPWNKTNSFLKLKVQNLIRQKYHVCNVIHLQEKLIEDHDIHVNRESLRRWCHEIHAMKRKKRRRTRPRFYRDRMPQRGLMIQMDGSHHRWFGNQKNCLIAAIDDATNEILHAEFFKSEDTLNCMKVIQRIIEKHGVFQSLYVDRAGIFGGSKRQNFAQLKRACEELGIQVLYAYSPQAKGRVERLFQTLQDRLIAELELNDIKCLSKANDFLHEKFLPQHYQPKFTCPPENPETAFQALSSWIQLREVFCIKDQRSIYPDHTISYGAQIFAIKPFEGQSLARKTVEIREYPDKSWAAFYLGKMLNLKKISKGAKAWR